MFIFFIYLIVHEGWTSNYMLRIVEKIAAYFFSLVCNTNSLTNLSLPIDQFNLANFLGV